jgi:hypothetical protein
MNDKTNSRSKSPLGGLDAAQRDALAEYCAHASLADGLRWLEAQFGIKIASTSTLSRWLHKHRILKSIESQLALISDDSERATLIGKLVGAAAALTDANIVLVAQAVFEELRKPAEERDEKRLAQYMTFAIRARAQNLTARSVDLAYERHRFNAAKRAMELAADLQQINQGGGDEREKIEKAIVLLFGEAPDGFGSDGTPADASVLRRSASSSSSSSVSSSEEGGEA